MDYDPSATPASDGSIDRYYDPQTGQFLSVDPLVALTGEPYGYVGGDPVNGVDPLGLCGSVWSCITTGFDTARHGVASGYDAANNAVNAAVNWASGRVNNAVCAYMGNGGGRLGGWIDQQAGCASGAQGVVGETDASGNCPLGAGATVGNPGSYDLNDLNAVEDYLKSIGGASYGPNKAMLDQIGQAMRAGRDLSQ